MTAPSPVEPPAPAGEPAAAAPASTRPPLSGPLRLLLWSLFPANLSIFLMWGALPSILLPLQIEHINAHDKAANLAIVTTIGALAAMLAQPLAGTLSDRTRSRLGPRAPYLVGGALFGGL